MQIDLLVDQEKSDVLEFFGVANTPLARSAKARHVDNRGRAARDVPGGNILDLASLGCSKNGSISRKARDELGTKIQHRETWYDAYLTEYLPDPGVIPGMTLI